MIPLVVNKAESMLKVRVMTVKDYSEQALKTLHKVGALHIEEAKELMPVDRAAIEHEVAEVKELLTFVDNVLSYIPQKERVFLEEDIEVIYTRPFSEIGGEVKSLYNKINRIYEKTVELSDEAQRLTELKMRLEPMAEQTDVRLKDLNFSGDYLFSRVFFLPAEAYESLYNQLKDYLLGAVTASVENEAIFYVIAKKRDQKTIESIVADAGGKILQVPDEDVTLREFIEIANGKIGRLEERLSKLREELQSKAREDLKRLVLLREALSAENERLSVLGKAAEAKYVTLIEGWIPESNSEPVISEVRESIGNVFIDTREPEPEEEPPIKLKNPGGFKPFQVVVNLFATPKYREWDPTPIISYSFALFFGLMVADVIYGIGVLLLSRFLLPKFVDDPGADNTKLFQRLLYASGGAALVLGLLSGNYLGNIYEFFGFENLALVPVIGETLQDPVKFIALSLVIGFVHVNIAHILALIKAIKERNKGAIVNKIGLFTLELGIPAILHSILGVDFPVLTEQVYSILSYAMLAGIVILVAGCIIEKGGLGVILGIFDLTGILGDIMSYARLAGVGLATFYLASSFNLMADLFRRLIPGVVGLVLGTILAVGVLFLGHTINLVLGVITGFIHSLRLCFVEFLFKFYEGGGTEYSPFKLRRRASLTVGEKT